MTQSAANGFEVGSPAGGSRRAVSILLDRLLDTDGATKSVGPEDLALVAQVWRAYEADSMTVMLQIIADVMARLDTSVSNESFDALTADGGGPIAAVNAKIAALYGARSARLSVAGSSGANLALGMALGMRLAGSGRRKVAIDRCCHLSMIGALAIPGFDAVWLHREYDRTNDILRPIDASAVRRILADNRDIAAVAITSPVYDGFICDIPAIADVCREFGALLIVDGAWGATHGLWRGSVFPPSPAAQGADACVISLHKKGFGPSQSAATLFNDLALAKAFDCAGDLGLQTTSPNYVALALAEYQLDQVQDPFVERQWRLAADAANHFADFVAGNVPGCRPLRASDLGLSGDPTHLLIHVGGTGRTGFEILQAFSREYKTDLEKATFETVLILLGPHSAHRWQELAAQFKKTIDNLGVGEVKGTVTFPDLRGGQQRLTVRDALLAPHDLVPLASATGRVAAQVVAAYPPGQAIIAPGEVIESDRTRFLMAVALARGKFKGIDSIDDPIRVVSEA